MELACDIVKKINNDTDICDVVNELKNINIGCLFDKYNEQHIINKINSILKPIFENSEEISKSITFAYHISLKSIKTNKQQNLDNKIINAAHKLVTYIEHSIDDDFLDKIDYYFALYKTLMSINLFGSIDSYFDKLEELIKIQYFNKHFDHDVVIKIINKMFQINAKITVKKILSNYKMVMIIPEIKNHFWTNIIRDESNNYQNYSHFFLIMVAELRIILLSKLSTINDKKDIYYKIDIEDIITYIRTNNLTVDIANKIIVLFAQKIHKLNNEFITIDNKLQQHHLWTDSYNELITIHFNTMFDIISSKNT